MWVGGLNNCGGGGGIPVYSHYNTNYGGLSGGSSGVREVVGTYTHRVRVGARCRWDGHTHTGVCVGGTDIHTQGCVGGTDIHTQGCV